MDPLGTVLIVSRRGADWRASRDMLSDEYGYRVLTARSSGEAVAAVADIHVDLVIAENGSDEDGLDFVTGLRVSHPEIIRVLALELGEETRTTFVPASVYQLVRKPLDPVQIALIVKRGLETRELARRHRLVSREFKFAGDSPLFHDRHGLPRPVESQRFEKLIYVSEKMAALCELARKAAKTELPILIQGETGTGKELLARAIHYNSSRRTSPLMVQNCGRMPDELLQSELFGHKRGAYTGAISDRLGLFRAADGGTVFLDEITEVSPSFQVSLLRFLQEGEVKPLGSDKTQTCNVRVIAASNRSMSQLVASGQFRQDLYFRIRGFEFEVPPLRDRPVDIPALAEFFAAKHADAMGRRILGISASVLEKLMAFDFPGNIRELENEIRRMVALAADGEYLTTQNMSSALTAVQPRKVPPQWNDYSANGTTLKDKVEDLEKRVLSEVLTRHRWNQSRAAVELGLSRVGLANKIKRYGLDQAG
jgi:two-component system response regulator HupR/HoxA